MFGRPPVRYRVSTILRPLPIHASIQGHSEIANFTFLFSVAIEILGSRHCTRDHKRRIDCREFAIKRTAAVFLLEKVLVKPLVSRAVGFRTLFLIQKKRSDVSVRLIASSRVMKP